MSVVSEMVEKTSQDYHDLLGDNGRFKPGNRGGPGRPKGSQNYAKVLHKAAPKLAKAYVKAAMSGNGQVLTDSRKYFLGDRDAEQSGNHILVFIGDGALPRPAVAAPSLIASAASSA